MNWKSFIEQESQKDYYKQLQSFLVEDGKTNIIYPDSKNVFNAFKYTPLDKVKVVILGQDPYHGSNQAHGLSFSVPLNQDIPPSLRNIYKEINSDFEINHKFSNGCLTNWAKQGVLLLNSVLTVRAGAAGSHRGKGWETFTDEVIRLFDTRSSIVFLLWGGWAKSKSSLINKNHLILTAAHPSPLSAYNGFFGCKHFTKTNRYLTQCGVEPIDWTQNS